MKICREFIIDHLYHLHAAGISYLFMFHLPQNCKSLFDVKKAAVKSEELMCWMSCWVPMDVMMRMQIQTYWSVFSQHIKSSNN